MKRAAGIALAILAAVAAADAPPDTEQLHVLLIQRGQSVRCNDPGGCAVMTQDTLLKLADRLRNAVKCPPTI